MGPTYRAEEWMGRTAVRHVSVSEEMLARFADISGDRCPIHVDDAAGERPDQRGYADLIG